MGVDLEGPNQCAARGSRSSGASGRRGLAGGITVLCLIAMLAGACGRSKAIPGDDGSGGAVGASGGSTAGSGGMNAGGGGSAAGGAAGTGGGGNATGGGGGTDPLGSFGACASGIQTGQPCSATAPPCRTLGCPACAESLWRQVWLDLCTCDPAGRMICTPLLPGGTPIVGDCIFELPLDCTMAGQYFSDPECTTHPACDGGT
jgi:hypothetical protein